jgi:hypothetical protein
MVKMARYFLGRWPRWKWEDGKMVMGRWKEMPDEKNMVLL